MEQAEGDNLPVAVGNCSIRTRPGGVNHIRINLDQDHAALSTFFVAYLTHRTLEAAPGRRLELSVPSWQSSVVEAAETAGFVKRYKYHRMGLFI
jgi:hypothetical protein